MSTLIKFMESEDIRGINIAMRQLQQGRVSLVVENPRTGEDLPESTHCFSSQEEAQDWYDSFPGQGLKRLFNALEASYHQTLKVEARKNGVEI